MINQKLRKQHDMSVCACFYRQLVIDVQGALELGPRLRPKVATTLTKRRLYCILRLARPVFFFFFS